MKLCIDTSKPDAQVALVHNGELLALRVWEADRYIGGRLLEYIQELMQEQSRQWNEIEQIVVHIGPGHFSSLRSGIVTAQMLGVAHTIPVIGVQGQSVEEMIRYSDNNQAESPLVPQYE